MKAQIRAEGFWMLHRRAMPLAALVACTSALLVPLARWLSTSDDVDGAVAKARADAADALARGLEIPIESLYQEPRYELATQLPVDVAALSLGIALMMLVAAAVSVGSEWRSGTVRLSLAVPSSRSAPAAVKIVAWWVAATVVGAIALTMSGAGLLAVGHAGGLTDGSSTAAIVGITVRGAVVVGAAAAIGAASATTARSDVAVVVAVLLYVLCAELLLVGLLGASGYQSPGTRAHMLVAGLVVGPATEIEVSCGAGLRCPLAYEIGWGSPAVYLALLLGVVGSTLAAAWSARRPVWR